MHTIYFWTVWKPQTVTHLLIRTRKGPDILFELANVRINRNSGKFNIIL